MKLFKELKIKLKFFKKKRKRIGRGPGSGLGKTCGRGHKGQKSRSGYSKKRGFEGGQTPFYKRFPKIGFTSKKNIFNKAIILDKILDLKTSKIDLVILKKFKLINKKINKVKILSLKNVSNINPSKKIIFEGLMFSKKAKEQLKFFDCKILL